jgi:hypothetical protein
VVCCLSGWRAHILPDMGGSVWTLIEPRETIIEGTNVGDMKPATRVIVAVVAGVLLWVSAPMVPVFASMAAPMAIGFAFLASVDRKGETRAEGRRGFAGLLPPTGSGPKRIAFTVVA